MRCPSAGFWAGARPGFCSGLSQPEYLRGCACLTPASGFDSIADVPEPEEGSEEQLDPVPLMDRSCVANVLEKVKLEFL